VKLQTIYPVHADSDSIGCDSLRFLWLFADSADLHFLYADTFNGYFYGTANNASNAGNSDSLGHLYYDRYLTNINDTFGFLVGDSVFFKNNVYLRGNSGESLLYIPVNSMFYSNKTFYNISSNYGHYMGDGGIDILTPDLSKYYASMENEDLFFLIQQTSIHYF